MATPTDSTNCNHNAESLRVAQTPAEKKVTSSFAVLLVTSTTRGKASTLQAWRPGGGWQRRLISSTASSMRTFYA
jgi:hypothetical protein